MDLWHDFAPSSSSLFDEVDESDIMGVISRGERIDGRWKTRRKSFPSTKKIKREGKRRISAASFFYKANNPTKRSLEEAKFDLLDPFALFSPFSESEAKRIANKRSPNVDLTLLVSREGGATAAAGRVMKRRRGIWRGDVVRARLRIRFSRLDRVAMAEFRH